MALEILMPHVSDEVDEGILVTWFVGEGAEVHEGDLVAEVQVEKVSAEVRADVAGRVAALLVQPGGVVAQGAPIATIEEVAAGGEPPPQPAAAPREAPPAASPSARRLARELSVDLSALSGSGPGGRIVEADVQAAAGSVTARVEPLSPMRQAIARRLVAGLASTAQLTLTTEADVTDLAAALERLAGSEGRPPYTAALVHACGLALRDHPRVAAQWADAGLARSQQIDIGVAVALADGLVAPVVRSADAKAVRALAAEIADLAARARSGSLAPAETQGSVFTVTNLGAHRVDAFTPLLSPPETAILGAGRARQRPAVRGGAVVPRLLLVLSLTFDHRVLDGDPAAAFLDDVLELLEAPEGRLLAADQA